MKSVTLLSVALPVAAISLQAQTVPAPLVEYKFNDALTSTTAANTGSTSATANSVLNLRNGNNTAATLISSGGVSGQAGDRVLNLSSSPFMGGLGGNNNSTPAGVQAGDFDPVDTMRSFTLSGWFKTEGTTPIGGGARIFQSQNGQNGFTLISNSQGTAPNQTHGFLELQVGGPNPTAGSNAVITATPAYNATQSWVFFAVTYDGTIASNNVRFYIGSDQNAVTQVGIALTLNKGLMGNNGTALVVGNDGVSTTFARAFDGYLDNLRIWGADNNTGVLSLAQLEVVRAGDAIPEPSSFAAFAGLGALGFAASRRRRRA